MTIRPDSVEFPVHRFGRALLLLWSLFLVAGFLLAAALEPDSRGFGTHQRLGLPPCSFRSMFQIPCPSCGMTTSFANAVRGRFAEAARANSAGFILAILCAVQIPWCWISMVRGRLWKVSQPDVALLWMLGIVCSASALQWVLRLIWAL
jgi:Protein of unknown function (DUF2752)